MELTNEMRQLLIETADSLKGPQRRQFMARTVQTLGLGQRQAQQRLGWGRDTLRKALHERRTGFVCSDVSSRGRKPIEAHLPHLLDDIRAIVADHSQTDPTFQTTQLYCRLTAAEVRRQLIARKGYTHEQLPSVQTITTKRTSR